jgi:hypothetical protein
VGRPPVGVAPWHCKPPTGNEMLPRFEAQRASILAELERAGEVVE